MITAKVIADSKNKFGNRITTMVVTFPRIILAEFNTHRMFSRNSASSRAIPFKKMVEAVENNPFIPMAWQEDHKGMQGNKYITNPSDIEDCKLAWLQARDYSINMAKDLNVFDLEDEEVEANGDKRVSKQICNRLLEPFMYHTVIVTATEWENFFALRCPKYSATGSVNPEFRSWKDFEKFANARGISIESYSTLERLGHNKGQAEIHMMALAEAMWDAYNESTPKELKFGEWHIPFGDNINEDTLLSICKNEGADEGVGQSMIDDLKIKIATARCARVSYTVVGEEGKEPNYEADIKLHDKLAKDGHWSPFEHFARCIDPTDTEFAELDKRGNLWSGNYKGFMQYRKSFSNENIIK